MVIISLRVTRVVTVTVPCPLLPKTLRHRSRRCTLIYTPVLRPTQSHHLLPGARMLPCCSSTMARAVRCNDDFA